MLIGVSKKFSISYKRGEQIRAAYNTDGYQNTWEVPSLVCRSWLKSFHQKLEEVSIIARKGDFLLKSFYEIDEDEDLCEYFLAETRYVTKPTIQRP